MNETCGPITFVVPGDLHLTEAGLHSHRTALWMVDELNRFVRPDFVQFIGDNVQNARDDEFALFRQVCSGLSCPYAVLVGDHDLNGDLSAATFRLLNGDTYGASSLRGFCFL